MTEFEKLVLLYLAHQTAMLDDMARTNGGDLDYLDRRAAALHAGIRLHASSNTADMLGVQPPEKQP